ncbi:MAG TPA: CrcB family protein [Caproiciproducens sp.]|nr:CrcB family protein [Caproiciproducens sp.]
MTLFLIGAGGACGALARYKLGAVIMKHETHRYPLGTFLINIGGAFLLGILCGLRLSGNPYFLLGDGFCGAFTTFSTFTVESVQLIRGKAYRKTALFVVSSVVFGILCFTAGYGFASAIHQII